MQNGCMESFNGRMLDELLNRTMFFGLDHAVARPWYEGNPPAMAPIAAE